MRDEMSESGLPPLVAELARRCDRAWPTMAKAASAASAKRALLASRLTDANAFPTDTSVIVFGSLARGEWTSGSDLDWTLLVDGPVQIEHTAVAHEIANVVAGERRPGPTGVFGRLAFSQNIVHFIGGDDDTNTNTTRRILLLLESKSLDEDVVRVRILKALLARYVGEDLKYHAPDQFFVPRFLLNDYVRYWRTMGVDSAQKRRDRADKWATRNVKLRLSRKLIFAAGLWTCLSCRLRSSPELAAARENNDGDAVRDEMIAFLLKSSQRAPLETLAEAFLHYEQWEGASAAFDAYEEFLAILDDPEQRQRLDSLDVEGALADDVFHRAKAAAAKFQDGLTRLFFQTDNQLTSAAQVDGVF